jgi:BirA family transcriptional regulator, biotin operon repressor / biotin---[acetyl-CoA-carboxylase] ligase
MSDSIRLTAAKADDDRLDPAGIERETPSIAWNRLSVAAFPEIGSTNDEALRRAREGAPSGLLVIAEHQTEGRGRKGRRWTSPPGSGLCFSLLVHPASPRRHWPLLSLVTSVAVARSIEDVAASLEGIRRAVRVDLKWPNDVLLSGRKAAGILIEATDAPDGSGAVVIGVGVNVGIDSVPPGMEGSAASLSREAGVRVPRRPLLAAFLQRFQEEYLLFERGERNAILEHWKARSSMWNGVRVRVGEAGAWREATTCGLSDSGAIRVRLPDGSEQALMAADVSVVVDNQE